MYTANAMKDGRPFPFRWLLPLAQLTFCVAIMWPIWQYLGLSMLGHKPVERPIYTMQNVNPQQTIILSSPFTLEEETQHEKRADVSAFLNLPAGFLQIPYAAYSAGKDDWRPKNIDPAISDLQIWRGLTWPFLGIIFWWMVGRSIESLLAARTRLTRPRIHWIEAICGLAIWFLAGGLFIMNFVEPPDEMTKMVRIGSGLWTLLGAAVVTSYLFQLRLRRRAKNQIVPVVNAPA